MQHHHIFLLTPTNPNDQNHRAVLIWSFDEKSARKNAYSVSKDAYKGSLLEKISLEDLSFYQDSQKIICRELQYDADYKLVSASDNELIIEYQNKRYALLKDDPQIE